MIEVVGSCGKLWEVVGSCGKRRIEEMNIDGFSSLATLSILATHIKIEKLLL